MLLCIITRPQLVNYLQFELKLVSLLLCIVSSAITSILMYMAPNALANLQQWHFTPQN